MGCSGRDGSTCWLWFHASVFHLGTSNASALTASSALEHSALDRGALDPSALDRGALDPGAPDDSANASALTCSSALDPSALDRGALDPGAPDDSAPDPGTLSAAAQMQAALDLCPRGPALRPSWPLRQALAAELDALIFEPPNHDQTVNASRAATADGSATMSYAGLRSDADGAGRVRGRGHADGAALGGAR